MFLLLNSIVASIDGFIIGISLKITKTKLSWKNNLTIFLTNFFIYFTIISCYYFFKFHFMTTYITTFFYLFLAWSSYHNKQNETYNHKLSIKNSIFIATAHSLDGGVISLNFVYDYPLIIIILMFSFIAFALLLIGYYFANIFNSLKYTNVCCSGLFIILAIWNLFF